MKLAPELPVDGVFPFLHGNRSFMHLGFHIFDVGFQSQNSEAAKPMVFTTTLLLIGMHHALQRHRDLVACDGCGESLSPGTLVWSLKKGLIPFFAIGENYRECYSNDGRAHGQQSATF